MDNLTPQKSPWYERYRVNISFFYAAVFLIYARPSSLILLILGLALAAFGIFLRQWAAGHIKKMDEVAHLGPYSLVRHPLYVGSLLGALGCLIASAPTRNSLSYFIQSLFIWFLFLLLVQYIYLPKAKKEEEQLTQKFGEAYILYSKETPRFIPKKFGEILNFSKTFQWELWVKNQEFMSIVGYLLILFLLISRYAHGK